ncbi:putative transcription factor bHLH041 [Phalaenopsis equestris]|uniref:putative transcription factor bHLH041 n=1 Tax=Phalaenopsis equestris TaxID=78828 RepID=UPI0009E50842|nr:putative transcription factor bHLH041 [Phalaenopsis equestris]
MDVWCFEDDNNHSSSSSGSLPRKPFGGYWSSFSSLEDNYVAGISHDEAVDRVELGDTNILNSSAVQIQEQINELNMLMDSMDSTGQVPGDIFQQSQIGSINQSNLIYQSQFQISNEPSHFSSNKSCYFDSSSSNYMVTDQSMLPTSMANQHSFLLSTMEDMALTRAMVSVISSSSTPSSSSSATTYQRAQTSQKQANYYPSMSSFQPYSSSKPPLMESHKNFHSQNMIKKSHNMLRNVNMLKDKGKVEETQPSAYQMQHMVSERRRRERLNASFHSLWQLLPPVSKKDKTSVLCNTVSYIKTLKDEIYELEGNNRTVEENIFTNTEFNEKSMKQNENVRVRISKSSETLSGEIQQIELVIMVRSVQCDLIRVLLQVLESIKAMEAISLLSFDAVHNSQQLKLLATLRLAIQGSTWDERTFKEAVAGAAHMALTMTA